MERKYYVVEEFQRKGPYNIEELKKYGITKDSVIWAFEFDDPKKASEIPELTEIFTEPKVEKKLDDSEKAKLSDAELLKQYEEIKKQEAEKKKEALNIEEKKPETPIKPIIEQSENKEPEEIIPDKEEIVDIEQKKTETPTVPIIEQSENKEPEEITFDDLDENELNFEENDIEKSDKSAEEINKEFSSNSVDEKEFENTIIKYKTSDGSKNVEYDSSIGAKDIEPKPQNYIIWSILALIFCCSPFAIISLITGKQVDTKYAAGDIEGAKKSSATTKTILIISVILSLIGLIAVMFTK